MMPIVASARVCLLFSFLDPTATVSSAPSGAHQTASTPSWTCSHRLNLPGITHVGERIAEGVLFLMSTTILLRLLLPIYVAEGEANVGGYTLLSPIIARLTPQHQTQR